MKVSNCKHETSNGRCGLKGCYAYRHKCYTEDFCKCHEPLTNSDRIRAMTDEELADKCDKIVRTYDLPKEVWEIWMNGKMKLRDAWLKWLQQPADHFRDPTKMMGGAE